MQKILQTIIFFWKAVKPMLSNISVKDEKMILDENQIMIAMG